MMKQLAASHVAKTLALCVCPVVTAGVVATKEPHLRRMIHKATAPSPVRAAGRKRAALSNVSLPPCTPVAPFATLPRVAAALPAGVGFPAEPGLTPTAASAPEQFGSAFNPGFGSPGAINLNPGGGSLGGGGGGGGVINPPTNPGGGGGVIPPPTNPGGGGGVIPPPTGPVSGVPEPETWAQVLSGLALVGVMVRFFRQRKRTVNA